MNLTATYGNYLIIGATADHYVGADLNTLGWVAPDGVRYRVRVRLQNYSGTTYAGDLAAGGCLLEWGGPVNGNEPLDALDPVVPSQLTLHLKDGPDWNGPGRWGGLVGMPDGAVQVVLEEADSASSPSSWSVVWGPGYLVQEAFQDTPSRAGDVVLRFHDGFRFLSGQGRAYAGAGSNWGAVSVVSEKVVQGLQRVLGPLGGAVNPANPGDGWGSLVTYNAWRPYVPVTADILPADEDPLYHLRTFEAAWLDADGGSATQAEALRALAGRFGCRVFQSGGSWHVLQRDLVAADPTAVPAFTYAAATSGGGAGETGFDVGDYDQHSAEDLTADTRAWIVEGDRRTLMLPVRGVQSTYAFNEPLTSLVLNGDFEEQGAAATDAEHWALSGYDGGGSYDGGYRFELDGTLFDFSPSLADRYVLVLHAWQTGVQATTRAVQDARLVIPSSASWEFRLNYSAAWDWDGGLAVADTYGGFYVSVGEVGSGAHFIHAAEIAVAAPAKLGEEARVLVQPVFGSVTGHADGTPVIPEGATLYFYDDTPIIPNGAYVGSLTLSRAVKVGDTILHGSLDADVAVGHHAFGFYWDSSGSPASGVVGAGPTTPNFLTNAFGDFAIFTTGLAVDGTPVSGPLVVEIEGPALPGSGIGKLVGYNQIDLNASFTGGDPTAYATLAHRGLDATGIEEALPRGGGGFPIGDGPLPDSAGGLRVALADTGGVLATQMNGGWKAGAYDPAGTEPSTGVGVEEHAASRALAQFGTGRERFACRFVYRAGQRVTPATVPLWWQRTVQQEHTIAGATAVILNARVRPGASLVLGLGTAREETVTVSAVAPGAGNHVLTVSATTYPHYIGEPALYSYYALPDHIRWDVTAAEADVEATELHLDSETYLIENRLG